MRLLEEFVTDMRHCGVEPVFFFDGVFKPLKKATQLLRRQEEVRKLNGKKEDSVIILPLLVKEVVLQHLRTLNVEINQTLGNRTIVIWICCYLRLVLFLIRGSRSKHLCISPRSRIASVWCFVE